MKTKLFWIGIVLNILVGMAWAIIGVVAIIKVYGISLIWWMVGIWLIATVLSYWPILAGVLNVPGFRTTDGE